MSNIRDITLTRETTLLVMWKRAIYLTLTRRDSAPAISNQSPYKEAKPINHQLTLNNSTDKMIFVKLWKSSLKYGAEIGLIKLE